MHEEQIVELLGASGKPLSITEIRDQLARKASGKVSYETTKRDLLALAARRIIQSKSIGRGRRVTWIFWASAGGQSAGRSTTASLEPFAVSATERAAMSSKELARLYDKLIQEHGELIRSELANSRYLVLCDGRVIHSSGHEPSDEEVIDLERKFGKICYVVTRDPIEESSWSSVGDGDFYPNMKIFVGDAEWTDHEVFHRGLQIKADFDTGNPDIRAFSNDDLNRMEHRPIRVLRRAFHLGKQYDYHLRTVKIGIEDAVGKRSGIRKVCRSVLSWSDPERNPFLRANPTRKGFVGRDLMLMFPFSILLSGRSKHSKVLLE